MPQSQGMMLKILQNRVFLVRVRIQMWVLGKIRGKHQILLQNFLFMLQSKNLFRVHSDQKHKILSY